jgi:hypothetical protein
MYGRAKEFKDVKFSMDVFRFAHEMQLTSLMQSINEYLAKSQINASDALEIFHVCMRTDNQQCLEICKQVYRK